MFVFLIGGLGVLSLFPVAMNNAGRVIGEERAIILAQTAVAQTTADCHVNFELPTTGSALVSTTTSPGDNTSLVRASQSPTFTASSWAQGYFVTMLDGPGRGQSRFIKGDNGTTMNVAPAWTPVTVGYYTGTTFNTLPLWTAPGSLATQVPNIPAEHYSITRMGLPERPLYIGEQVTQGWPGTPGPYYVSSQSLPPTNTTYSYGTYGLNRDLVILSFPPGMANAIYAGIANPSHLANNVIQADPFLSYCGVAMAVNTANTLNDNTQNWPVNPNPPLSTYYQVRIVRGTCAGQVRTIIANTATQLTVAPNWGLGLVPDNTSLYEIGWANTSPTQSAPPPPNQTQDGTWSATLYSQTGASPSTHCVGNTFKDDNPTWPSSYNLQGKYIYIYDEPGNPTTGVGQALAIVSNTSDTLTLASAFQPVAGSPNYKITDSCGYVLITSGRAANRLFPIAWDANNANGHLIVCSGANFQSLGGITAAGPRGTNNPPSNYDPTCQYNLQNATTFTVIGNLSPLAWPQVPPAATATLPLVLNAVPDGSNIGSWTTSPNPPPWFNGMNAVGNANRLALDQYNTTALQGGSYTSDYSYGVIFSDSGTDPNLPVRVDVLVWRAFDINKDFIQNHKPVGHMTGYIKRP